LARRGRDLANAPAGAMDPAMARSRDPQDAALILARRGGCPEGEPLGLALSLHSPVGDAPLGIPLKLLFRPTKVEQPLDGREAYFFVFRRPASHRRGGHDLGPA
jgi:hypothetical protein